MNEVKSVPYGAFTNLVTKARLRAEFAKEVLMARRNQYEKDCVAIEAKMVDFDNDVARVLKPGFEMALNAIHTAWKEEHDEETT